MKKILLIILLLTAIISYSQDTAPALESGVRSELVPRDESIGYQSASDSELIDFIISDDLSVADTIKFNSSVLSGDPLFTFEPVYADLSTYSNIDINYDKEYKVIKPFIEKKFSEADYIIDGNILYMRVSGEWIKLKRKKLKKGTL